MEKQKYPCVLKLSLSDGRNYWTEIQHFKVEEDFDNWMHYRSFNGTKILDYHDFKKDYLVDTPVHYKN
jgi:hypothetical protein